MALQEQERAERMSSAAYRAPELWDVPLGTLDLTKTDIFALGCVFYASLYAPFGFSPFEHPLQGILPLAARTASVSKFAGKWRRSRLDSLVESMLQKDPQARPFAASVVDEMKEILQEILDEDFETDFTSN
jgi:serine/threonine protein kinase